MSESTTARRLPFRARVHVVTDSAQSSVHYAAHWLRLLGARTAATPDGGEIVIAGGDTERDAAELFPEARCVIRLWDFQVARAGSGVLAAAVCGASAVIGHAHGPGIALPADLPEKWCGAYGVILALAELWRIGTRAASDRVIYDVSAADVMRSFALQNGGSAEEIDRNWQRNGKRCIDHGGIFPMGFFACQDGDVAILGRSRRDWRNIRQAIGNPSWADSPDFEDPFALARNSQTADALLERTLTEFTRDELLERGLAAGAVIAPVYTQAEALARGIFRADFMTADGPAMPFVVTPFAPDAASSPADTSAGQPGVQGTASAPLAGLRCVELCWVWSGPMVGQILADLGAEVIKVESPGRFDLYRTRGVENLRGTLPEHERIESSLHFHSLNRNKRGLCLDLKQPAGHATMMRLIARSQLLLENFTVGTLDRLGLGAAALAGANSKLIQLSMSGPGRGSAVESLRSYGLVLSALAGVEYLIEADGEFVGSPTFSISDPNAAAFAAMGALAGALKARESGVGGAIDLSQIEAAATLAGTAVRPRSALEAIARTADGHDVAVSVPQTAFADTHALIAAIGALPRSEVMTLSRSVGGQAVDLLALGDTALAPEFTDCAGWCACTHPVTGDEQLVAAPWRVNGHRPGVRRPAPRLGEGNDYVLGEIIGLSNANRSALGFS